MTKAGWRLASFAFAALLIALWQFAADHGLISRVFFPAPSRAFDVLREWVESGELWLPLAGTVWRTFAGWIAATVLGVILGAIIASSTTTRDLFEPSVEFLRPLPSSAMIPPAILLLGLTDSMVVAVVVFGSIWPILLGAIHGFRSVEPRLMELSRALRLGRAHRLWRIALPNALPDIFAGMRVSLAIALIITSRIAEVDMMKIFWANMPLFWPIILLTLVMIGVPETATWLPRFAGY